MTDYPSYPAARKGAPLSVSEAETIAIKGLTFVAANEELMTRFLALSGLDIADVKQLAGERSFLAGVISFLAGNEKDLIAFCEDQSIPPEQMAMVDHVLNHGSGDPLNEF
ncbi:MAG: DUF3572 domain-containing protein [Pseudomonadota bacterium]